MLKDGEEGKREGERYCCNGMEGLREVGRGGGRGKGRCVYYFY